MLATDPRTADELRRVVVFQLHRQVSPGALTVQTLKDATQDPALPDQVRHTARLAVADE